ncbi:Mannose-1-phosphate guanylyltransferase [Altererythrobacter insulae]|nr:Mannose-1-phosphate guanylyltransferase [Altererythrobacter insulae]
MSAIHPVILCGGAGTRLWPLSRKSYPKQFVNLIGDDSLFQASARRLQGDGFSAPVVVTGSDFRFVVVEQLAACEIAASHILIEPAMRNTAAAVCAAALAIHAKDPNALMFVSPSDHLIRDTEAFGRAIKEAQSEARAGQLVTFGVKAHRAETGYGWLKLPQSADLSKFPCRSAKLIEKPNAETAQSLLESGDCLWNSGMFLFSTRAILDAFELYEPETLRLVREACDLAVRDLGFTRLDPPAWDQLSSISIDYAILEKADNLSVVPYAGDWSDLGDWNSVRRAGSLDANGCTSNGSALPIDCKRTLLHAASDSQQVIGIGLEDTIVVAMPDAVLVAAKDRAQDVKEAVELMKQEGIAQGEVLPRDYRPWGWYEGLEHGDRFQVKRISVKPGAALSLQSHHHRAEHWIIVEGTAKVTIGDKETLLTENQSVYVPLGEVHRLENPGKVPLTFIEVQTGAYLGEDDIVRYEDLYARQERQTT